MTISPELIALCIKQDRRAEHELYKRSYSYLMGICMRYARDKDSASAALNIGFMKVLKNLSSYDQQVPFNVWTRKIMVNTLIDEYRKIKREREKVVYVETYYDNSDFCEVNQALERMDYRHLLNQISLLPEATRKVFNLFAIDGYAHKEIAEMLGISQGTSKWHLNAARQKLKEYIENKVFTSV
ncbi:MAG: RNA polymerase sigma factor [Sphingobacteriia bacterium]|jgi:RNA polymerase sigma-70 factor (ECF subfamily)|nr:RNA polymerase sigma factor [Sphingobacteriia bacterium]